MLFRSPNSELGNEIIWEFMDACKLVAGYLPLQNDHEQLNPILTATNNRIAANAKQIMSNYIADKEKSVRMITRVDEYQTFNFVYALDFVKWAQSSGYSIPKDLSNLFDELITTFKKTDQADLNNGEGIEGKMPRTAIGKLAVQAAWDIEKETKRRATYKQVMTKLQEWADAGANPDCLIKSDKVNKSVKWSTNKTVEKNFTSEACSETLRVWNKSRHQKDTE